MSDRSRVEEVKNIGDAGDSIPNCLDATDNPVCEMLKCIKSAVHCGDHQSLKAALEKLEIWRNQKDEERLHDYWRVAQLTGETELSNVCILLTVTSQKPENVRWHYLQDALSVLVLSLCNQEVISSLLLYASNLQPVLTMAIRQTCDEEVYFKSLVIINKMLIVCKERFIKVIFTPVFVDALVEGVQHWLWTSIKLTNMILQVVKSMLMCGQNKTFDLAARIIKKSSDIFSHVNGKMVSPEDEKQSGKVLKPHEFFDELKRSIDSGYSPHECATYWNKEKCTKELLCEALGQPWLFIHCSWPQCRVHNGMSQSFFRKCGACSVVRYCSRQCQTKHWNEGHQVQCKAMINRNKPT